MITRLFKFNRNILSGETIYVLNIIRASEIGNSSSAFIIISFSAIIRYYITSNRFYLVEAIVNARFVRDFSQRKGIL
jgi:hypothetical protein